MKAQKEMEGCSFKPDTYNSKRTEDELQQREFFGFLADQQKYLENKQIKIMKQ